MPIELSALAAIAFVAATMNGALGYGFSSLTVPVALLFFTARVLNPALVLVEVVLNAWVVFVNRRAVPAVWRRMLPIVLGLPVGVVIGTLLIARVDPRWMKVATFTCLIPLILIQAAGYRRPLRWGSRSGAAFGSGLGVLYSVTTISGPPLAALLTNEGYAKHEFRAGIGLVRLAESTMTLAAYAAAGILTSASLPLIAAVVPSLALGVPLGAYLLRNVDAATFRRVCMSLDAWLVAFGLASVLRLLNVLDLTAAAALFAGVAAGDIWLWLRRRWWHQPMVYVVEPSRATFAVPSAAELFSKRYVP